MVMFTFEAIGTQCLRQWPRIIESVDVEPAPLRMLLGSQALESTLTALRKRIASFESPTELAASCAASRARLST
jgi:hypothetical protein